MIATSTALYKELRRLIPNLPDHAKAIRIVIELQAGAPALIECTEHADLKSGMTITKQYELVEKETKEGCGCLS